MSAANGGGDAWYVDKLSGERLSFTESRDEAMVTFPPQTDADVLNRIVRTPAVRSISRGANLRRGFAAVYLDVRDGLAAHAAEVDGALPVMIDRYGLRRFFLPGEFTVQFRPEVDEQRAAQLIGEHGSRIVVRQRTPGYYTLAVPEGSDVFAAIRAFAQLEEVAFAEPSEAGFDDALDLIPDDPDFGQLWGLHNTGQTVNGTAGTADIDIDAPSAWDLQRGDPDVIVVVIDTGADLDHPDLQANILPRGAEDWDFSDAGDPSPDDEDSHGTHVAGTAAAVDNTVGVIGVAPGCRIMPLRINLTSGMNQNRADAINYVAQQAVANPGRRHVVNCSWRTNSDHAGVRNAIATAAASNVLVVFAAGNDNGNTDVTPQFPGVYPEVVAVAALDQQGVKATFSNFGGNVDVAAPGVNTWSSVPDDTHGFKDGTSMAAPHVTGVAALAWSAAPELTSQEVRFTVEDSCDSVAALNPGFPGQLGRGLVNARSAVDLAHFTAGYAPALPAL